MTTTDTIDYRKLTDADWRSRLSPQQYDVLRKHGTERPGSSALNREKRKGIFACAGCDLPLFSSETKFESGTGWPSFYQPLPGAISGWNSCGVNAREKADDRSAHPVDDRRGAWRARSRVQDERGTNDDDD